MNKVFIIPLHSNVLVKKCIYAFQKTLSMLLEFRKLYAKLHVLGTNVHKTLNIGESSEY